jgi:hypothetical protein
MGRVLMARLLGTDGPADYLAPVELAERASLAAPENRCSRSGHVPACDAQSW